MGHDETPHPDECCRSQAAQPRRWTRRNVVYTLLHGATNHINEAMAAGYKNSANADVSCGNLLGSHGFEF